MTTTNRLCCTVSKRYIQAGTTFEIKVKTLLADDCKNNICDWSIKTDFVKMALYRKVYTNVQHFINNKLCFV